MVNEQSVLIGGTSQATYRPNPSNVTFETMISRVAFVAFQLTLITFSCRFVGSTSSSPFRRQPFWSRATFYRGGSASTSVGSAPTNSHSKHDNNHQESIPSVLDSPANNTLAESTWLPEWKKKLPKILQNKGNKTLQKINLGGTEIYLLGTAHVSNDSSADVKLLLEAVEPDCIFVELCEARIALLEGEDSTQGDKETDSMLLANTSNTSNITQGAAVASKKQSFWDRLDQVRQSQGGSRLQALSTLLLTSVQEDYAETLGVELGGEFKAAHQYWKLCHDPEKSPSPPPSLVLGDRPLSLTLVRAWESLWWWPKTKVMAGLIWSSLRKPDPDEIRAWLESVLREETDVLTESLLELRQHFPSLYNSIIAERDAWLAAKLVQTCRILTQQYQSQLSQSTLFGTNTRRRKRLVAIVGAGHVPGILQWLVSGNMTTNPHSSPEEILLNLTATKRWSKDAVVQTEMVPTWTREVTQVHHNDAWSWADPSTPPVPQ